MRALEAFAAGHDLGPLRARDLEVARNGHELVVTGNRADLDIRIESMADFERAHLLAKHGHEPVMYAGGYDKPAGFRASPPAAKARGVHPHHNRQLQDRDSQTHHRISHHP